MKNPNSSLYTRTPRARTRFQKFHDFGKPRLPNGVLYIGTYYTHIYTRVRLFCRCRDPQQLGVEIFVKNKIILRGGNSVRSCADPRDRRRRLQVLSKASLLSKCPVIFRGESLRSPATRVIITVPPPRS